MSLDTDTQSERFKVFLQGCMPFLESRSEDDLNYFKTLLGYAKTVFTGDLLQLANEVEEEMGPHVANLVLTGGERLYYEAKKQGRAEGREYMTRNLIRSGCSEEMLLKATGFSIEKLYELGLKQA